MHVHFGVLEFFSWAAYAIIFGFLWRTASALLAAQPDGTMKHAFGAGMAFIF